MATFVSSSSRVNADSTSPPMSPLLSAQRPGLPASAASLGARLASAGGLAPDCLVGASGIGSMAAPRMKTATLGPHEEWQRSILHVLSGTPGDTGGAGRLFRGVLSLFHARTMCGTFRRSTRAARPGSHLARSPASAAWCPGSSSSLPHHAAQISSEDAKGCKAPVLPHWKSCMQGPQHWYLIA